MNNQTNFASKATDRTTDVWLTPSKSTLRLVDRLNRACCRWVGHPDKPSSLSRLIATAEQMRLRRVSEGFLQKPSVRRKIEKKKVQKRKSQHHE